MDSAGCAASCGGLRFKIRVVFADARACGKFRFYPFSPWGAAGKIFCFHTMMRGPNTQLFTVEKWGGIALVYAPHAENRSENGRTRGVWLF